MKPAVKTKIESLAQAAIQEKIRSVSMPDGIPVPVFRGNRTDLTVTAQTGSRRSFSPFALVAAALIACVVIPPLAVGGDGCFSQITAEVHSRGEVERCRIAALDILALAGENRSDLPRR